MAESQARRAHRAGEHGRELPEPLRQAADDNPEIIDAYDHGRAGGTWSQYVNREPASEPTPPEPVKASAPAPAPEPEPTPPEPTPPEPEPAPSPEPITGRQGDGTGSDAVAGVLVGALLYALLLSLVNYGPSGPKAWLSAKFLNQPITPVAGAGGAALPKGTAPLPPDTFGP